MPSKRPEIMAPVAGWEMCLAAVHNGADAIYLGAPHFNARGRTPDLAIEDLKRIIQYCHLYGVKVFIALNVLIFERELELAETLLREVLPLRPDAFIVQDLGMVRLLRTLAPWQAVHASTQMTISNAEAITITSDLGLKRYVLAREVSIPEMQRIRAQTDKELEVFVHGALCVAYSGQCLTSESTGGRSANRGQCAQSCRLPYELLVDGKVREMGDKRYLVSPQDLCGIGDVERLIEAGIDSFKIEGRLKSPEYVASTVRNYREVCERAYEHKDPQIAPRLQELSLTFARGRFNGWFDGVNHQRLVDARIARPTGVFLGTVSGVTEAGIDVHTSAALLPGDGVVFYQFEKEFECGGIVFSARSSAPGILRLRLGVEFSTEGIREGMEVFHNSSSLLDKKLRQSFYDRSRRRQVPLHAVLRGAVGERVQLELKDHDGHFAVAHSYEPLAPARSSPLTYADAFAELSALSGTAFELTKLDFQVVGDVFLHNRELKRLRRTAVREIMRQRTAPCEHSLTPELQVPQMRPVRSDTSPSLQSEAELHVLIRDETQLAALEGQKLGMVYLDYEYNKEYEDSLARVREMGFRCAIATTRILKPGELGHLKYIQRLKPDAILVRNLGALQFFQSGDIPLIGDFSLNVSNSLTGAYLRGKKLVRVTASYDLNREQLLDLAAALPQSTLEVTVHQYMPAFHMEHCVFAAFLSNGTSYRDCGRPCEKHRIELRDPTGTLHPVKADAECRNTMFQGKPQSAARLVPALQATGVRDFRLEALFENAAELRNKISSYQVVIQGQEPPQHIFSKLGIIERYGVTEGQLFNERTYQDRKKQLLSIIPQELQLLEDSGLGTGVLTNS